MTFAWQTFASLRLFACLVYVSTYCVPIAHLRQNKPFTLLYLGYAQITRCWDFIGQYHQKLRAVTCVAKNCFNRTLPSSKNPHFQNEARCTTFLVKMSFICMRMKNDFHIKGWAPTLVSKQRPGETRKWPIEIIKTERRNETYSKLRLTEPSLKLYQIQ